MPKKIQGVWRQNPQQLPEGSRQKKKEKRKAIFKISE
jgi:hypothetical protein